jgi:hypothetical protein
MFAEIGLDATKLEKGLEQAHKALTDGTIKVESAYKSLGIKSDAVYDQMRKNAVASFDFIKNKTTSSLEDITRAYSAATERVMALNAEQFRYERQTQEETAQYIVKMMKVEQEARRENAVKTRAIEEEKAQYIMRTLRMEQEAYRENAVKTAAIAATQRANYENSFTGLGVKSEATFAQMRAQALNYYKNITSDSRSTFSDRLRAQQGYSIAVQRIDHEQLSQEKNFHNQRKQMSRDSQAGWLSMMKGMLAYRVILSGIMAVQESFSGTFRYLATIETAQLGIGAAFMTSGKYIDITTGKALKGAEALKAAQVESKQVIEELKAANLQTIATLDQLIVAYQQTLPVAMAKGFDKRMVKEFTLAMVQAAGAIGLPMDQLGEETRSMLTGAINPRTSRIATVLGLRNEDIAEYKNNAEGLFTFLMDKLKAYQVAGVEAQTTWAGLWSNMKDIAFQYLGEGMTPLFEGIKQSLIEITNSMVTVNEKTKQIEWNPEFLESMKTIKSGMTTFIADLRRISMLIDLVGIGMAKVGQLATLGLSKTMDDAVDKYTARLKAGEKALMDMAMAAEGYKPATKDTPGAITQEGLQYYDKTLWYVKETAKETKYMANETKKVSEEAKHLADQWKEQARTLDAKIAGEGLDKYQRKVIEIAREAEKLTEKFRAVAGATAKIAEWKGSAERGVILEQEAEVAKAVQKIRDDEMKDAMDNVRGKITEEDKFYKWKERALKEYEKIVTEANDWDISEHQRAINKIRSSESTNIEKMKKDHAAGAYGGGLEGLQMLFAGIDAARTASAAAEDIQTRKALADKINFYSEISGYEDTYYARLFKYLDEEGERRGKLYEDDAAGAAWAAQEKAAASADAFNRENSDRQAAFSSMKSNFASMADLYAKDSRERKALSELSKAAAIAEMAVQAQKNIMIAVGAVAQQGTGDPYSAFARIAAMIALMSNVLGMAGIAFGGGGGGASAAPALPASTVLGAEAGTGSESIAKVWDLLEDTYELEYRELTGIHNSMKDLNRNITGLVTSIVRTGSVSGAAAGFTPSKTLTMFGTYGMEKEYSGIAGWVEDLGNWFLNTVVGGIFGGGKEKTLESSGIEFKAQTAGQLIAGEYMDALEYAVIKTVKDGGWFHSDKTSYETIYKALDEDVSRLFSLVFVNMSATLVELAKGLGADVNAALAYQFKGERLNLAGKTGEEINKIVSEYFSNVGDEAVRVLFGDLVSRYQQLNEGLFETAARLVMDKAIVSEILTMTNQGFPGSTAAVIAFSEAIIEMAGDLETLQDAAATYYDKFFTDAEKQARLQEQLSGGLGSLGYALPADRMGYRDIVEGLDLTTESGQKAYVMLLEWAEAADQYYSAVEDAAGSTEKLTKALQDQVRMITDWISDMSRSSLAPAQSMEGWQLEYERQKTLAYTEDATTQDVSSYLNFAKEYLSFMRTYGGDYQDLYNSVIGDVGELGEMKNTALAQLDAILAADNAAQLAAARQLAATYDVMGQTAPAFGGGGLMVGPSIGGEMGKEWAVPTYEPQRSNFLSSAPPEFWENLRGGGAGPGDITVHSVVMLDGKVLGESMAKQIPRNGSLISAIQNVPRRMN